MLVVDFDGVVCDALQECALITWLGANDDRGRASGQVQLKRVPTAFVRHFRKIRDYSRTLDHFALAHLPYTRWIKGQRDFERIFRSLPEAYVSRFTAQATTARTRLREEEPDFWLGMHTLYPGIARMLERHAGTTAIVTAKDEGSVRDILRRHRLEHTVTEVIGECASKAEAIRDLCARHRIPPARATFIDDNLTNARKVSAVGVHTLWATWGYHTPEDLANAHRSEVRPIDLAAVPELSV